MHIHLPKVPHSWRELAQEVGVIVVGILIALGLEQAIEKWRHQHRTSEAREAVHAEMATDLALLKTRIEVTGCVSRNLDSVERQLNDYQTKAVHPTATTYFVPDQLLFSGAKESHLASGNLAGLPTEELSQLAQFYDQLRDLKAWQDEEHGAWLSLSVLQHPQTTLQPSDFLRFQEVIQRARALNFKITSMSTVEIQWAAKLGVTPGNIPWLGVTNGAAEFKRLACNGPLPSNFLNGETPRNTGANTSPPPHPVTH